MKTLKVRKKEHIQQTWGQLRAQGPLMQPIQPGGKAAVCLGPSRKRPFKAPAPLPSQKQAETTHLPHWMVLTEPSKKLVFYAPCSKTR